MIQAIDSSLCEGCGTCDTACPADVIRIDPATRKAVVVYLEDCMTCYNCERLCPGGAIRVGPFVKEQPQVW